MSSLAQRLKPLKYLLKSFVLAREPGLYWGARRLVKGPLEAEIDLIGAFADKSRIALDVGANFGAWSYALSRNFQHCHAFEPQPRLASLLRRGQPAVTVHEVAVSDRSGRTTLRIPRRQLGRSTIDRRNQLADLSAEPLDEVQVATVRLDELGFGDTVAFLKVDVEGHEHEVLEGAAGLIEASRPVVLVETEDRHCEGAPDAVRALFRRLEYTNLALGGRNLLLVPHGR